MVMAQWAGHPNAESLSTKIQFQFCLIKAVKMQPFENLHLHIKSTLYHLLIHPLHLSILTIGYLHKKQRIFQSSLIKPIQPIRIGLKPKSS